MNALTNFLCEAKTQRQSKIIDEFSILLHSANLLGSEMWVSGSEFWICEASTSTSKQKGAMARY